MGALGTTLDILKKYKAIVILQTIQVPVVHPVSPKPSNLPVTIMHFAIIPMLTASVVFAQTSTVTPTPVQTVVDLFLGAKRQGNYSFAASVISADNIATTYEIMCKSGDLNIPGFPTTTCDLNDPVSG